ncbi:MAG: hypothetical protein QI197_02890 [Candidatus Korarchaeota archaeon]|nr:hypothetical protein [Candidatus Korarchaeota archaeon]
MTRVEVSQGVYVICEIKEENGGTFLECSLRRQGRLGLKLHEKLRDMEEIEEIMKRPRWLGEESDRALRRALSLLLGKVREN